jgi:hypothetical protein
MTRNMDFPLDAPTGDNLGNLCGFQDQRIHHEGHEEKQYDLPGPLPVTSVSCFPEALVARLRMAPREYHGTAKPVEARATATWFDRLVCFSS